jgi:ATP-binding protein involved in chromosome partitioning
MTECGRMLPCALCLDAETCPLDKTSHNMWLLDQRLARIQRRVLVLSNKGGVGKSTVAANLAAALAAQGNRVGLADCDISGPSIPRMFGLVETRMRITAQGTIPPEPIPGLKVASLGFLLSDPDEPVMWRDAFKQEYLEQLFNGVAWGDLDWLIVDMPPGTGGELIGVVELLMRVDGAVIVTTPQEVALQDARRAINGCRDSNVPILGIVENMSGLACPHCGGEIHPFAAGGAAATAEKMGVPVLGQVPLDPSAVILADAGMQVVLAAPDGPSGRALLQVAASVERVLAAMTSQPPSDMHQGVAP